MEHHACLEADIQKSNLVILKKGSVKNATIYYIELFIGYNLNIRILHAHYSFF